MDYVNINIAKFIVIAINNNSTKYMVGSTIKREKKIM